MLDNPWIHLQEKICVHKEVFTKSLLDDSGIATHVEVGSGDEVDWGNTHQILHQKIQFH